MSADTIGMTATWEARGRPVITGNKMARLTARDKSIVTMLEAQAELHSSGGTYQMVAAYVRHSFMLIGYNKLTNPASRKSRHYHSRQGMHSELHLVTQMKAIGKSIQGGTVYVVGRRKKPLPNSSPCAACRQTLKDEGNVRYLVYLLEGVLVKEVL